MLVGCLLWLYSDTMWSMYMPNLCRSGLCDSNPMLWKNMLGIVVQITSTGGEKNVSCSMMCNGTMKYSALVSKCMYSHLTRLVKKRGGTGAFPFIIISFSIHLIFLCPVLLLSVLILSVSTQVWDGIVFFPSWTWWFNTTPAILQKMEYFSRLSPPPSNWFCLPSCAAANPLLCRRQLGSARLTFPSRILTFCLDLILGCFFVVMRPDSNWLAVSLSRRSSQDLVVTKWMSVPVSGAVNKQAHPNPELGRVRHRLSELICATLNPTPHPLPPPTPNPADSVQGRDELGEKVDAGENEHLHLNGMFSLVHFRAFHLFGNGFVMCASQPVTGSPSVHSQP